MDKTRLEQKVEDAAEKAGGILRSKYGLWALGAISFAESALPVPIITDPFMVAHIMADRAMVWRSVIVTTITSVTGGVFAYAIAFWFYEFIAAAYLHGPLADEFALIADEFNKGTFVITILGAVTPVPYTIVAMAAGFVQANIMVFIAASLVGRVFRYGLVGWLTYWYGQQALAIARRHLILATVVCFALAAIYFFVLH